MMNEVRYMKISPEEVGQRLDNYLIRILKGVPKSYIYRIIRQGEVRINKKRAKPTTKLQIEDMVRIPPVRMADEKPIFVSTRLAASLETSIIYEDDALLVINKPAGLAVHGGSGVNLGAIEALRKIRHDLRYLELIHRLDKETSGCLLLAKKRSALRTIHALLANREVHKIYWALLEGRWRGKPSVVVDVPLKKNALKSGERFVEIHDEGKASHTTFNLLENYHHACLMEVSPKTGRTHQIRVHSAYLKHPIIGDEKYGKPASPESELLKKQRLYLHARTIQFNLNGKQYSFQAELDETFNTTLAHLRQEE